MRFRQSEVFLPRPQQTAMEGGDSTDVTETHLQETVCMN
jgi:hypothetical protein